MKKSSIFVGLDVHKNSIEIAIAEAGRNGEVRSYGKIDGSLGALDKVIRKLVSKGYELHFVYEAGPCGYEIYRHLAAQGFDCMVVAPAMIPKQSGNRIKNDHRDAQMLARLHRAGELSAVFVPFAEDEAMRDLTRSREDAKLAEKRPSSAFWLFFSGTVTTSTGEATGARRICVGSPESKCLIRPNRSSFRNMWTHSLNALAVWSALRGKSNSFCPNGEWFR